MKYRLHQKVFINVPTDNRPVIGFGTIVVVDQKSNDGLPYLVKLSEIIDQPHREPGLDEYWVPEMFITSRKEKLDLI